MTVKLVSGYTSIPGHPRSEDDYMELGRELMQITPEPLVATRSLESCWMHQFMVGKGIGGFTASPGDNAKKNTLAYHAVQHQKVEWMLAAAAIDPRADVLVWVDFGIFHQRGVTIGVIQEFLRRAATEREIAIPGCWGPPTVVSDDYPNWRFCGSVLICPRKYLFELDLAIKLDAMNHMMTTGRVSWEVNTWARVEAKNLLPIRWYQADHDKTMFTEYPGRLQ